MYEYKLLLVVVVMLVVSTGLSDAICRFTEKMTPVNVNMDQLALQRLNIVYRIESDFGKSLDYSYIAMTKIGDSTFRAINTLIMKDNSAIIRKYTMVYKDGIMNETFDNKDDEGNNYTAKSYILAESNEGAILFYRCSDVDYPNDLRFIVIPDGKTLSNESLSLFMTVDKSFNFNIDLFKLPYNFYNL